METEQGSRQRISGSFKIDEMNLMTWKIEDPEGRRWICERGVDISGDLAGQGCWQV